MRSCVAAAVLCGALGSGTGVAAAAGLPQLLVNPGFESGAAGWTLPRTYRVVEDIARNGSRSLCVQNTNPATYLLARQAIPFQVGRRYRYGAWIRTRGVRGDESGATLCVEWSGAAGWMGGSYADGQKGDQDWFHVEGVTGPIPTNATSVNVELYLRQGMTGTAWFDDVTVSEEIPPPLEAALLSPNYRGRLRSNRGEILVQAVVGDSLPGGLQPEDTDLSLSLRSGGRVVAGRRAMAARAGAQDLRLEARGLPPGDYQARVELSARSGARVASREFDLRVEPAGAAPPAVSIDEHNRTLVNGRPFFPLGWYFGPGPGAADFREHIDRIAASPFNTIMCYGVNAGSSNEVRRYLDYLASRNVKIIYSIKDVYEGTRWHHEPVLGWRGEETIVRNVVAAFREHPALLAWYLNDELPLTLRQRLEERYRLVARLDPDHPTWAVLYQVDDLRGYLGTADVLGTDPYPIPDQPVTLAAEWTLKSRAVSAGRKPLWMVPQAFDWASYRKDPAKGRPPTLDEELVMTYLCLIHGAHGLIFYSYADLLRDPRMGFARRWADMLVVGQEVKQLEPALLSTAPAPKVEVTAPSGVHHAVRADEQGRVFVLLANPGPAEAAVRVDLPVRAGLGLLRHGALRPWDSPAPDGKLVLKIPPLGAMTLIAQPGR